MDTQEFLDTLKIWLDSYRETRDPRVDRGPADEPAEIKWEENMMKVASVISPADSIYGTPALEKVYSAVRLAKSKDRSKMKEIYDLLNEVEKFLKD